MSDHHVTAGRIGAHESWARTTDRSGRTSAARRNGPASLQWHLDRLPAAFDTEKEAVRNAAAESARKAYYARLSLQSAQARKRGAA